jgi:molybdate transport system substrate-binding protein
MKKLLFALLLLAAPGRAQTEIVVSAAASLQDALTEIGARYEKQNPNIKLRFNFGSSGALQTQIENGAPVDIFIAAADENMDALAAKKLIDAKTRRVLASNRLVLIAPKESRLKLKSFKDVASPQVKFVALGGPNVPAGKRAEEVFAALKIWPAIEAKAVRAKDVRAALAQVELGNADAGVVYRSDAATSDKVRVVATAPESMHKPIRYPFAVVTGSKHSAQAARFAKFLNSDTAKRTLKRFHFVVNQ